MLCAYDSPEHPARIRLLDAALLAEYTDAAYEFPSLFATGTAALREDSLALIQQWRAASPGGRVFVTEHSLPSGENSNINIREAPEMHDYILSVERLVNQPTAPLRVKHKHAARFRREHPAARVLRLDMRDAAAQEQARVFFDNVRREEASQNGSRRADLAAFQRCIAHAGALPVEHHAIVLEGRIIAMQALEFPVGDCCFALFQRQISDCRDVRDYFDLELARQAQQRDYQFFNIGEDMGLPNLRMGKSKWDPVMKLKMYELLTSDE